LKRKGEGRKAGSLPFEKKGRGEISFIFLLL